MRKHGVSFDEAVTVFYDPLSATFDDPDHSTDEHRLITIGISSCGRVFVVSQADSTEKEPAYCYCCDNTGSVGYQTGMDRIPDSHDGHSSKIDGRHVEGRFSTAHYHGP